MKNIKVLLSGIFAVLFLMAHCAEQPIGEEYFEGMPSIGANDAQHVDLVIYGNNPVYMRDKITAFDSTLKRLEDVLNVTIVNKEKENIVCINQPDGLLPKIQELIKTNHRRIIIIAKDTIHTRSLLSLLAADGFTSQASINKPFHTIILLNPAVTTENRTTLISSGYCERVYHRIYNFYLEIDTAAYRLVYPASERIIPSKGFYFVGTNIFCQTIMPNGDLQTLTEEQLLTLFDLIPNVISHVDKYHLHSTFNGIFLKNFHTKGQLPFVWIRKGYGMHFDEYGKPHAKERNYTLSTALAHGRIYNSNYKSGNFTGAELAEYFNRKISEEVAADFSYIRALDLPQDVHEKAETSRASQEALKKFTMVEKVGTIDPKNPVAKVRMFDLSAARVNDGLCQQEKDYLAGRAQHIKNALQAFFDSRTFNWTPTIAVVASGGGSRAMFATLGVLKGLMELKLFDAVTYLCGLSGSTWAIGSLYDVLAGHDNADVKAVINKVGEDAATQAKNFSFIDAFLTYAFERKISPEYLSRKTPSFIQVKQLCGQPVTNTDFYGAEIARTILGKNETIYLPNYIPSHLSSMQDLLNGSRYPLPILTAGAICNDTDPSPAWFEFTPYEVGAILGEREGNLLKGAFVPTKLFGSNYTNGSCTYADPEQPLEFYLGVCGSALNLSLENLKGYLPPWLQLKWFNPNLRFAYAAVHNPVFKLDGAPERYKNVETVGLFDAGLIFNLPFPVLNPYGKLRQGRNADIIIFIDASDDNYGDTRVLNGTSLVPLNSWPNGYTLRQVKDYADKNRMPFPAIPAPGEDNAPGTNTCQIYSEPHTPLIIYYPVAVSASIFDDPDNMKNQQVAQEDNHVQDISKSIISKMQQPKGYFQQYYQTQHTNLEVNQARILMAIMEYNVLYSKKTIMNAIGDKVSQLALSSEAYLTELQIKALITSLKTGRKTIDSLTLQECNALIKKYHPEQPTFANEQKAKDYLIRHEGRSLEHSVFF